MDRVKLCCTLLLLAGLSCSDTLFAASGYALDTEKSSLYFVSTKKIHVIVNAICCIPLQALVVLTYLMTELF